MRIKRKTTFKSEDDPEYRADRRLAITVVIAVTLYSYFAFWIPLFLEYDVITVRFLDAIGSYVLIVGSIFLFGPKRLATFRDQLSLWFVVAGCLLAALLLGERNLIYKIPFALMAILLATLIIVRRKEIEPVRVKSVLTALFWSLCAIGGIALIRALVQPRYSDAFPTNLLGLFFKGSLIDLALTSMVEEGLFRGLIFSLLLTSGYSEKRALLTQGLLFWGMHYLDITNPKLFWIILPVITCFLTLIIKKYKMLYMSVTMHTLTNVFGSVAAELLTRLAS